MQRSSELTNTIRPRKYIVAAPVFAAADPHLNTQPHRATGGTDRSGICSEPKDQAQEQQAPVGPEWLRCRRFPGDGPCRLANSAPRRRSAIHRDGAERGVGVLNDVIDQAARIARQDAEEQRERQHHQRRQRCRSTNGAYALGRRPRQHVLPDLIGARDVIGRREAGPKLAIAASSTTSVNSRVRRGKFLSPRHSRCQPPAQPSPGDR